MYAIFGEKNARIADENWRGHTISHDDFLKNFAKDSRVIIDKSGNDFILEKMCNCRIYDAYAVLKCREKVQKKSEWSFIIPQNVFFKKHDFYIQTDVVDGIEKFAGSNVFLIEHVISEFCKTVAEIGESSWWMYAAEHASSGIRIVAGIGEGVLVSRVLPTNSDLTKNMSQTIRYVKRFGYESGMKIISLIPNLNIDNANTVIFDVDDLAAKSNLKTPTDAELFLMNFASRSTRIPAFSSANNPFYLYFMQNLKHVYTGLIAAIFVLMFAMFFLGYEIFDAKKFLESQAGFLSVISEDTSKNFRVKITEENSRYIKDIANELEKNENPLQYLPKIQKIFRKAEIKPEKIEIKNANTVNVKCNSVDKEALQNLLDDSAEVSLLKANPEGAELCVKFK